MDEEEFNDDISADDMADLWLKRQKDEDEEEGDKPDAEADEPDEEAEGTEDEAEEGSEDEAEGNEDEADAAPVKADDEADVSVTVDGKELNVKVKDLKRLYGQEASLTQKSQAVSAQARTIETQSLYLAKIMDARITTATERVAKFADVDLFKASRELSAEDFDALHTAKKSAEAELATLQSEGKEFMVKAMETRKDMLREQAKVAVVELKQSIPEWNDELYRNIRKYAVEQGMSRDTVNEIVDPGAIVLIHKAMLFDAAKAKSETVAKKLIKSPKTALSKGDKVTDAVANKLRNARKAAAVSGDVDDVAEAWLAARSK